MPRRSPCLDCGRPSPHTRCPTCQQTRDRARNQQRTHYHGDWQRRSRQTRQAWVDQHGWVCPGIGRPPHPVPPGDLTLDHTTGLVCCHACNVTAGPAGPHSAIPH